MSDITAEPTTTNEKEARELSRSRRILLAVTPILLPLGAVAVTAALALNISRVFLATSRDIAVGVAIAITVGILVGASLISYAEKLRTSSLTLIVGALFGVAILAGSVTLGASEGEKEQEAAGYVEPEGEPVQTFEVDALPSLKFQADQFTIAPGITNVRYVGKGGTHTLVFERGVPGFLLEVAGAGETVEAKAELGDPEYTIYCTVPGHRAAGMEAKVIVSPDAPPIAPPS